MAIAKMEPMEVIAEGFSQRKLVLYGIIQSLYGRTDKCQPPVKQWIVIHEYSALILTDFD